MGKAIPVLTYLLVNVILSTASLAEILVVEGGCTLPDAVIAANLDTPVGDCPSGDGDDLIRIESPLEIGLNEQLLVTSNIRIESNSSEQITLRAERELDGVNRIFYVLAGDLVTDRISIDNGWVDIAGDEQGGGGIRVIGGSARLQNCELKRNFLTVQTSGSATGAALYARNSNVELIDCRIYGNGNPTRVDFKGVIALEDSTLLMQRVETSRQTASEGPTDPSDNFSTLLIANDSVVTVEESALITKGCEQEAEIQLQNSQLSVVNSTLESLFSACSSRPARFGIVGQGSVIDFANATLGETVMFVNGFYSVAMRNSIMWGECQPVQGGFDFDEFTFRPFCGGPPGLTVALTPLQDNGGPTRTRGLFWNSSAVNAGDEQTCTSIDQRGNPRTDCDLGAYEFTADSDIDVSILAVSPGPYVAGQAIDLDVNIDNLGADTANGIRIDFVSQNFQVESIEGACTTSPCTITALEPGNPALPFQTVRVTGSPIASGQNSFSLTATATPEPDAVYTDIDPSNDSDTLTESLTAGADLRITKTLATPPPYAFGDPVEYDIEIDNSGPGLAENVVFTDTPQGLEIIEIDGCDQQPAGPCDLGNIGSGGGRSLTVTARINENRFDNIGEVDSDTFDPDPLDNIDSRANGADVEADADTRISISRETNPPFFTGQTIEYIVRLSNAGPDTATNVTFDLETENYFPTAVLGSCTPTGSLPCNVGNLAPGSATDVTVRGFAVAPGSSGFIAFADSDQLDSNPEDNIDDAGAPIIEAADVSVELTIDQPSQTYARNQILTYVGRVQNAGDDYADNIELDLVVENLEILGISSASCTSPPCTIPTLARPASETLIIVARILELGPFDLTASVVADQFDPVPDNNTDDEDNGGTATINDVDEMFSDSFEGQ
jgi:uncharacterized repeat protein (TIGR01451 family)